MNEFNQTFSTDEDLQRITDLEARMRGLPVIKRPIEQPNENEVQRNVIENEGLVMGFDSKPANLKPGKFLKTPSKEEGKHNLGSRRFSGQKLSSLMILDKEIDSGADFESKMNRNSKVRENQENEQLQFKSSQFTTNLEFQKVDKKEIQIDKNDIRRFKRRRIEGFSEGGEAQKKIRLPSFKTDIHLTNHRDSDNSGNSDTFALHSIKNNKKITEFFNIKRNIEKTQFKNENIIPDKELINLEPSVIDEGSEYFDEQSIFITKTENEKLKLELSQMRKLLASKDSFLNDRVKQLQTIQSENLIYKERVESFEEIFMIYKKKLQTIIVEKMMESEKLKKNYSRSQISAQRQRLGEYVCQRDGAKFQDVWIDGYDIRSLKERLVHFRLIKQQISNEREEIEKSKKNLKNRKSSWLFPNLEKPSGEGFGSDKRLNLTHQESISNYMEIEEIQNFKKRLAFRIELLNKEELMIKDSLEKLDREKIQYIFEAKRLHEEDHSRFGRINQETGYCNWPVLGEKFQILSFLGKGGFSEVYKGFDLDELKEVACKIHQLNPNWSEKAKANYIKHALRENNIHKELNHDHIVKLFETVEIDSNSFCTVLEFCSGPDLSQYMKTHKILPEKEAKLILSQILSGIKYLHQHKHKIIHYDLKPQNIIFHKGEIKISDFGLCKIMEEENTKVELTSQGVGTYWYLPPECFELGDNPPKISQKVDIWSIGVAFFEMVFGCKPFGNNMSQERILKEQVILRSRKVVFPQKPIISNEAKDFIRRCLEYSQDERMDIEMAVNHIYISKK